MQTQPNTHDESLEDAEPEPNHAPNIETCPRCGGIGRVEEFGIGWTVIDVMPCPGCRESAS